MSKFHLAQLNIARLLAPLEDPRIAEFVSNFARVNQLAEESPGFIWRLQDDKGNALSYQAFEDPLIISNLSVWENLDTLRDFVYRGVHREFLGRRKEWFHHLGEAAVVLWWLEENKLPTLEDGLERLQRLREIGPSPQAFSFSKTFLPESLQS